ncbi:sugar ABC transporter substrate-binding protein [Acetobacteraceae bacterium H6797]|nr:sugar ABC transporter substrate-binding protein [Acetobacteraceae bacterium H6797]
MTKKTPEPGLKFGKRLGLALAAGLFASVATAHAAKAETEISIAAINNDALITLQRLSGEFERQNPDIKLRWMILDENTLRQRITMDIATRGGQFDLITIGNYEVQVWAKQNWLAPLNPIPASYRLDDLLPAVRQSVERDGQVWGLPIFAESAMTFYRKDLFEKAGITPSPHPTFDQIREYAEKIHEPANGVYGICMRGQANWGGNMALVTTLVDGYGGQWFDDHWRPMLDTPEWRRGVSWYVDMARKYGPPGTASSGFSENLALTVSGHCGMWIDSTFASSIIFNPRESGVADKMGYMASPVADWQNGAKWLWSWVFSIPETSRKKEAALRFATWATSKEYIRMAGEQAGWVRIPQGTRVSTYQLPEYQQAAPFASMVEQAISAANPIDGTRLPKRYVGAQFVGIPEFQAIGTSVGQQMAAAIAGNVSVNEALRRSQNTTSRIMMQSGYYDRDVQQPANAAPAAQPAN